MTWDEWRTMLGSIIVDPLNYIGVAKNDAPKGGLVEIDLEPAHYDWKEYGVTFTLSNNTGGSS